jgi:hypothetical protein
LDNVLTVVSQQRVKREIVGLTLNQETSKKEQEGGVINLMAADFTEAFLRWYECCEKCMGISSGHV